MKECRSCGSQRPLERFREGRNTCTDCYSARAKERYQNDPEFKAKRKAQNLRRLYGITQEEYNEMFQEQEGCCAVCGTHASELTKALAVDHDHDTGVVRALLCTHCNTALGSLNEDTDRILRLYDYARAIKK